MQQETVNRNGEKIEIEGAPPGPVDLGSLASERDARTLAGSSAQEVGQILETLGKRDASGLGGTLALELKERGLIEIITPEQHGKLREEAASAERLMDETYEQSDALSKRKEELQAEIGEISERMGAGAWIAACFSTKASEQWAADKKALESAQEAFADTEKKLESQPRHEEIFHRNFASKSSEAESFTESEHGWIRRTEKGRQLGFAIEKQVDAAEIGIDEVERRVSEKRKAGERDRKSTNGSGASGEQRDFFDTAVDAYTQPNGAALLWDIADDGKLNFSVGRIAGQMIGESLE